jgi:hypothetical protein
LRIKNRPLAFIQKSLRDEGKGEGEKEKVSFPFPFALFPTSARSLIEIWLMGLFLLLARHSDPPNPLKKGGVKLDLL